MLQWRLKLRAARRAIAAGRYEEACRLLSDAQLREFLPAKKLADELASRFADRAAQRIEWGQSSAGFADLAAVDQLGAEQQRADGIRHDYARQAEQEAEQCLQAGDPRLALATLDRAQRRGVDSPGLSRLHQAARAWREALQHAESGDMLRAEALLESALRAARGGDRWGKMEVTHSLDSALVELKQRAQQLTESRERLHQAAIDKDWPSVLRIADESLRLAPRDQALANLRRRAWRELELDQTRPYARQAREPMNGPPSSPENARRLAQAIRQSTRSSKLGKKDTAVGAAPADRRMLWVDAVGGYLVCLDDEVVIGQPAGGATPALPVLADISRRHAVLRREQGAYVLDPIGPTTLDGAALSGPTVLGDKHTIQLGDAVTLEFVRPHALSATARLTFTSGHRTAPTADAVLLMAESCVLGAGKHSHVRCRDWQHDVILFRQGNQLLCRSGAELSVDGLVAEGPASLGDGARIEGQDFAMCVELV